MWSLRAGGRRAGSRLFVVYAVASLIPVLILGILLARDAQNAGVQRALGQGRAQAAVIEEMAIAPALTGRDLSAGLEAAEMTRLQRATDLAIYSGSVSRLRLRDFTGRVVFSDDGSRTYTLLSTDAAFRTAVAGGTVIAVVADPAGGGGQLIRVLQPVVPNATGRATGVLELYLPYAPIAARVHAQLQQTYWRLGAALTALYVLLGLISWSSTRRLRRHAADREHQALHDTLTGLPNREWFRLRAESALHGGARGGSGAVVLVDLDRFKEVNDTWGHHAGDELLRVVAQRLTAALRTDDTVARLGGDEFGLLLPGLSDAEQAVELLSRVRDELAADITLESVQLSIEASFGVALYPEHGSTVEHLLKRADAAMYQGKRGAAGIVVFESLAAPEDTRWLVVQAELRHALQRDELVLHYQPKVDLVSGRVHGVEALLRWQHPQRGLLGPAAFLPAAEHSGLIEPLTTWVLRRALRDQADWSGRGVGWSVAVNVSARNLGSPRFAEQVTALLAESGVAAGQLCVEITETALTADPATAAAAVTALAAAGVTTSIDDFGSGYTSLSQLRSLPIGEIKIDLTFVQGLREHAKDRAIVRSVIELAHGLDCSVTAEGVESSWARDWLRAAGADSAQGYHFARPAPWPDLLAVPTTELVSTRAGQGDLL